MLYNDSPCLWKDFASIAQDLGTKSESWIGEFFNAHADKCELDVFINSSIERPGEVAQNAVEHMESAFTLSLAPG
ncbi:rest corepressor (corest) protein [Echinococcus multilocularis]|uniref:Rest corepressor (Corest) protein n=1 Tax=Echinococcus multilocularis TaxID=6211 RepID=A0A0S4MKN7_ECHMU|nr:rest corepressor (corest) protein [Echinococcus multilocularis]